MQQANRFAVIDAFKRRFDKVLKFRDSTFFNALVDELHVVHALVQDGFENIFQKRFGQIGVVIQIGKGHFRLDHPELGKMACGVRIFGTEGRAKSVNLRQCQAERFNIQLARNGEENFLAEKIFREINLAFVGTRQVHHVQCRDTEHLAGTFGIGRGNDWRVNPIKTFFMEEAMNRLRHAMTQTCNGAKQIRAWTQMRDFTQEFQRMRFRLNRISFRIIYPTGNFDFRCLDFKTLALALRSH